MSDFLTVLIPIAVAALTTFAMDGLKSVSAWIDDLPALAKQALVAVIAVALTKLAALAGVSLSTTDLAGLSPEDVSALASAGLAYLFHTGKQNKELREGR